ncbi:MAG TPA: hypothetical protein VFS88_05295 [Micavibrio sp.]|nr:hypothetical protein [Micavibrio sp.]
MGDITDRPKAPKPQVVYVPQYVHTPAAPAGGTTNNNDNETPATEGQQREKTLLSRSRSRLGTILTGFRGILAPSENENQRKTLLGE